MELFYCVQPSSMQLGNNLYKYQFRLEQTEHAPPGSYLTNIIFGSAPEWPLENFVLTSDIPGPFDTMEPYLAAGTLNGYLLSGSEPPKYVMHESEEVAEEAIFIDSQEAVESGSTRKLDTADAESTSRGKEARPSSDRNLIGERSGDKKEFEAFDKQKVEAFDLATWVPSGVGAFISWTGTATNEIPEFEIAWSFLEGNFPFKGQLLKARRDCSRMQRTNQELTMDYGTNILGLTDSGIHVDLSHLVNDDVNELQDLAYNYKTNELSLSSSNATIDLSPLDKPPQELEWNSATMELGLSGSSDTIDLSPVAQDLSIDGDTNRLEISSSEGVDLSFLRIVALQASINDVNAKDDDRRLEEGMVEEYVAVNGKETPKPKRNGRVRGSEERTKPQQTRLLKKSSEDVTYGGYATSGWTLISSGRLIGMTITADDSLKEGSLRVTVVECSDLEAPRPLGDFTSDFLLLTPTSRSQAVKFVQPIPVKAGDMICFDVTRLQQVKSPKGNAASLVLTLEQY